MIFMMFLTGVLLGSVTLWPSLLLAEEADHDLPAILSLGTIGEDNYLPDFSYAGYGNGLPDLPKARGTVINVDEFGARADDGIDDSKAVLTALARANRTAGPVIVRFSAGRYRVSDILRIERSSLTLQGAGSGAGGTVLYFPRPLDQVDKSNSLDELRKYLIELDKRQVEPDKNLDDYFSEYSWSGGFIWIQKPGRSASPLPR